MADAIAASSAKPWKCDLCQGSAIHDSDIQANITKPPSSAAAIVLPQHFFAPPPQAAALSVPHDFFSPQLPVFVLSLVMIPFPLKNKPVTILSPPLPMGKYKILKNLILSVLSRVDSIP
jgi:hypothetical protein